MFLNHWVNVGSGFMPSWFMVGSMVVQICLMFGSVLVLAWFNFGSDLVQAWFSVGLTRCAYVVQIRFLVRFWFKLLNFGFPFESDVVHFGFRCVSILVQLRFSVRSSLASFGFRLGLRLVHMCSRHGSDVAQSEPHLNRQWFFVGPTFVQIELYVGYSLRFSVRPNLWRSSADQSRLPPSEV
jgi:hypothetical protein